MSLLDLRVHATQSGGEAPKPAIDPEAAVMRLKEAATRFLAADQGPRFKVGDLITPIRDSMLRGAGEPYLVVAVRIGADFMFVGRIGNSSFGQRLDLRVLSFSGDSIRADWVESAEFELWRPAP